MLLGPKLAGSVVLPPWAAAGTTHDVYFLQGDPLLFSDFQSTVLLLLPYVVRVRPLLQVWEVIRASIAINHGGAVMVHAFMSE